MLTKKAEGISGIDAQVLGDLSNPPRVRRELLDDLLPDRTASFLPAAPPDQLSNALATQTPDFSDFCVVQPRCALTGHDLLPVNLCHYSPPKLVIWFCFSFGFQGENQSSRPSPPREGQGAVSTTPCHNRRSRTGVSNPARLLLFCLRRALAVADDLA